MRNKTKAEKMRQQKHLLGLTESNLVRLVELGGQRVAAVATSSSAAAAGDRAIHVYKRALRSTFGPSIVFHNHVEKHSCSRVFFLILSPDDAVHPHATNALAVVLAEVNRPAGQTKREREREISIEM